MDEEVPAVERIEDIQAKNAMQWAMQEFQHIMRFRSAL